MEIAQTAIEWQEALHKKVLGKIAAITLALTIHGSLLLPLFLKPDHTPPVPISIASFEFVNLPIEEINDEKTAIDKIIEPIIEEAITQPEVITPPEITQDPTPAVPQEIDDKAIPVIKKLVKAKPAPISQPKRKPPKKIAQQKKPEPKPVFEKKVEPKKIAQKITPKSNSSPNKQNIFTPPVGRVSMLNNPKPIYPVFARRRGLEGLVLLSVDVNSEGYPLVVKIKKGSGHKVLDRCALQTVKKWRFIPAKRGDIPVRASVEIPIRFSLVNS
ncbi:MAG: energy transducer TonB [Magnetococcales bacterium]|nr:energy transducer TonB [Magnetococcales bacterium]